MERFPLVIVANEPVSYRSLLATELPFLRLDLRVLEVDPADLAAMVRALRPSVVVCSRAGARLRASGATVLALRAGKIDSILQTQDETVVNTWLADVPEAIDRAISRRTPKPSLPRPSHFAV